MENEDEEKIHGGSIIVEHYYDCKWRFKRT